ncbi:FecR family protein [Pedobacter nutrimenti]|uniref:FecR family protein n=1 Tax=Pedobacter nutrimenti TaxID=1241337 RepID=UPI00293106CF|nr:FecR domain-containing protein [Pedobacter nutrimenti]
MDENNNRLPELFKKYISKTITEEEKIEFLDYVQDPFYTIVIKELISDAYENQTEPVKVNKEIKEKVLNSILSEEQYINHPPKLVKLWPRVAAVIAVIVTVGLGVLINTHRPVEQNLPNAKLANEVTPEKNNATLTLANGEVIALDSAKLGSLASQHSIHIKKTTAGDIHYTKDPSGNNDPAAAVEYNEVATYRGGWFRVTLSDGTRVVLNAASSLSYPTQFNGRQRIVKLKGEAYFEVAKDKKHPFIVTTDRQKVIVLGTHFNINSYGDEPTVNTTLLEGSVKVTDNVTSHSELLKPGQQSVLKNHQISVRNVDTEEAVAWKNGYFMFNNEGITSIMRRISRWYNIEIIYNGPIPDDKFNGSVDRSGDISVILQNMELTNKVHFKMEGRRVTVSK